VGDRFASLSPGWGAPDGAALPDDECRGRPIQRLSGAVLYAVDTGEKTNLPPSPVGGYG